MISPPFSGRHSGRATPSLRASQKTAHDKSNRQKLTYPELKSVQTKPTTPNLADGLDGYLIRRAIECATITYDQLTAGAMPGGADRVRRLPASVAEPASAG